MKRWFMNIHERWSLGIAVSTNDKFEQISFVNGIATPKGGKHVDYITNLLVKALITHIEKKEKTKVKDAYIKNYLKVFLNSTIENPGFDSQTKERLITSPTKFGSKPVLNDKFIKKVIGLGLVDKVLSLQNSRIIKMRRKQMVLRKIKSKSLN